MTKMENLVEEHRNNFDKIKIDGHTLNCYDKDELKALICELVQRMTKIKRILKDID